MRSCSLLLHASRQLLPTQEPQRRLTSSVSPRLTPAGSQSSTPKPIIFIDNRPGEQGGGRIVPASTDSRYILVEGWYGSGFFNLSKVKMLSSSVHYSSSLSTVVWFQDPGSSASIGPNLSI